MRATIESVGREARAVVLGCCVLLLGCAALVGIEGTTDEVPGGQEAGQPEAPAEDGDSGDQLGDTDGDIVLPSGDAGLTDESGGPIIGDAGADAAACDPVSTFIPVTGATGTVCNANNLLPNMAGSAGLDRNYTDAPGTVDGKAVASCVGANFPKPLVRVVVRAASISKACDVACTTECGTGHDHSVFVGSVGAYKYAGTMQLTSTYASFDVAVPVGVGNPTQVVVCRTAYGMGRDDVVISGIVGICKD
jgi:hypothetical protein